ncbi:MAG: helicase-exonuclease AddAB subunit AddB, partial [Cyanobacteria bacterium REEB65]|nr:helicase-exonuclease AddAB subunit AddB [Cyanobacteria bacterium REEB65]
GQSRLLAGAQIWVDGFFGFTPQEYRVLVALAERASTVCIALCLDAREGIADYPENALFRPTLDTLGRLKEIAGKHGFASEERRLWEESATYWRGHWPELAHLERFVAAQPVIPLVVEGGPARSALARHDAVRLVRAADRRSEVEAAAREILRLTREKGYRFGEIAVCTPDLVGYADLVEAAFVEHDIPHFVDRRRSVAHHPAVELLRSAVEVAIRNWPTEAVFRYLKTDLVPVSRSDVDKLENLALEHGLKGRRWAQKAKALASADLPFTEALQAFVDRLQAACSVKEACSALFALLEDLQVEQQLATWSRAAADSGDFDRASEHEQLFELLVDLLEQMVAG